MRLASVPGYYPSFPVKYSNMYNDYSMTTAGLADPFLPQKKEESNKCNFVVSYIGRNEPKFEMNNPHYMREVSRNVSQQGVKEESQVSGVQERLRWLQQSIKERVEAIKVEGKVKSKKI